jgi:NTP pyrophosphatase (non-canonical NTP hydrolase)
MNFSEYQEKAGSTALYPNRGNHIAYPALGLAGEAGEVAEKVKKILRGDRELDDEYRAVLRKEIGDVLWYVAAMCHEIGADMQDVAEENIAKLASRKARGVIRGSGDDR